MSQEIDSQSPGLFERVSKAVNFVPWKVTAAEGIMGFLLLYSESPAIALLGFGLMSHVTFGRLVHILIFESKDRR